MPVSAPEATLAAEAARKASEVEIPVAASDITVGLDLEQRKKGLLWFPTYGVDFRARYTFAAADKAGTLELSFPLEERDVVYDGFQVSDEAGAVIDAVIKDGSAHWSAPLDAGQSKVFQVAYRARGTTSWHYQLTAGTGQTKSFRLAMKADTDEIDFPAGTLSPSSSAPAGGAWQGEWAFSSLIANAPIGVELPQRVNPGPLAARITFFAPVGLLFFFFVIAISSAYRNKEIHPLNYFFFGCAFFAFHLLFSYLVDHLSIAPAFTIAAAVSVVLIVTYARLFTGWTFALREMGISQLLYLVLFSLTFLWTGFTGLAITVGAVLSLFVMMQLTGRARWSFLDAPMRPEPPSPAPRDDAAAAPPAQAPAS
ncbi:MAG: inner membrane CreD family protein [Polyangiaceae bacterium]